MNQKYLKGEYSGGLCSNQSTAFEALPKNIAAFLARGRLSGSAKITTLDDKPFLTALSGIIDICPDQRFLREQLLPVLVPMQMAETPVPILKPIPHEVAEGYKCPLPDWNYLRWRGVHG